MKALKVVVDGVTTSFRYPHFLVGRHPSLPLPPPSTIYGHICSACGFLLAPDGLRFGYTFLKRGTGDDIEHLHVISEILVGRRGRVGKGGAAGDDLALNLSAQVGPVGREIILFPHLELYITADDEVLFERVRTGFECPAYPVVLGRSQDLCSYRSVEVVCLEQSNAVYYEGTILPWSYRLRTTGGYMLRMAAFIDPESRRRVVWQDYLALPERAFLEPGPPLPRRVSAQEGDSEWVDPTAPMVGGKSRAVVWHSFAVSRDHAQ